MDLRAQHLTVGKICIQECSSQPDGFGSPYIGPAAESYRSDAQCKSVERRESCVPRLLRGATVPNESCRTRPLQLCPVVVRSGVMKAKDLTPRRNKIPAALPRLNRPHAALRPNNAPIAAVARMASAPQKVTRSAPRSIPAPLAPAPSTPRTAKPMIVDAAPTTLVLSAGVGIATSTGTTAPAAKLRADTAARTGRTATVSEMPSSSRAWGKARPILRKSSVFNCCPPEFWMSGEATYKVKRGSARIGLLLVVRNNRANVFRLKSL